MYARGILFGKMKYELGDHSYVRCPENNLVADIEFKTKGYFSGTYNAIGGTIKNEKTGEVLYELSGMWNGEMHIKNVLVRLVPFSFLSALGANKTIQTHQKEVLFDATHAKHSKPSARPINEQAERESQRLWEPTVKAILAQNHAAATDEKTKIEDRQREEAAKRADEGVEWRPRLFRAIHGGPGGPDEGEEDLDWILNAEVYVLQGTPKQNRVLTNGLKKYSDSHDPETAIKQILAIAPIVAGQKDSSQFQIPPHASKPSNAATPALPEQDTTGNTASAASSTGNNTAAPSVVERKDTETQEVDQFVDAEEKQ
jgi:hypothetical protein